MLTDTHGRTVDYLRISVTDRCDLRCTYCIPKGYTEFEKPAHWLTFEEIERVVRQFAAMGTRRFRLTGGEPLLRKNIVELVARLKAIGGVEDLSLSTNATQLQHFAHELKKAGLDRLNVSLDSLERSGIKKITGYDAKAKVMAGLEAAADAGFLHTKINMVPLPDINENEIDAMVAFCLQNRFTLRLIELMPMGAAAKQHTYVDLQPVMGRLADKYDLEPSSAIHGGGPARYWQNRAKTFSIGYITPISRHFCETCNRVRMSVDGTLYMCLGQEYQYELAPLLRNRSSDEALKEAIKTAVRLKPLQHSFNEEPDKIIRIMAATGG